MSLLDAIKKKKSHLKPNETRVTTVMGQIFREQTSSSGDRIQVELHETSPGYVVDETPDIQVAFVLPWLCFGSQDVVCDVELLNQNQISRVLSLDPRHLLHVRVWSSR
ncbi:uncharacterized protein LOC103505400 [Diaphorina citri]|uniref:Uncharacterized protein LOC103505400 n=1 Tax=Diaphorina citri TaxID=121845 RepID=A0A3Q0IQD2_DIACI|nr:uncharacterized protein LOC103505400 [Diaphorina citri]